MTSLLLRHLHGRLPGGIHNGSVGASFNQQTHHFTVILLHCDVKRKSGLQPLRLLFVDVLELVERKELSETLFASNSLPFLRHHELSCFLGESLSFQAPQLFHAKLLLSAFLSFYPLLLLPKAQLLLLLPNGLLHSPSRLDSSTLLTFSLFLLSRLFFPRFAELCCKIFLLLVVVSPTHLCGDRSSRTHSSSHTRTAIRSARQHGVRGAARL
mmetsp:Transcript_884/g.2503  ORF Transcript_884/g.2503 Transcript_884/m.2503 type:complete len:212 (+) Transcript_884:433-1068(+)